MRGKTPSRLIGAEFPLNLLAATRLAAEVGIEPIPNITWAGSEQATGERILSNRKLFLNYKPAQSPGVEPSFVRINRLPFGTDRVNLSGE